MRGMWLLLLAAVTLVLAALWLNGRRPTWLAQTWQEELIELPDERLTPRLRQAADLGEAGIPLLVDGLYSPHEPLAAAAASVLDEELCRWAAQSAAESLPRRVRLSESLAERVAAAQGIGRLRAAEIAERLLSWPFDAQTPATRVTLACEQILAARPRSAEPTRPPARGMARTHAALR